MAQQQFNPIPDVSTHADVENVINSNATDAENRLTSLELNIITVTTTQHTQVIEHTHHNYDDDAAFSGGGGPLYVNLLPVSQHSNVTVHKKIGSSADVVLVPPSGVKIDGITGDGSTNGYHLTSKYESVSIYTDGNDYFIQ